MLTNDVCLVTPLEYLLMFLSTYFNICFELSYHIEIIDGTGSHHLSIISRSWYQIPRQIHIKSNKKNHLFLEEIAIQVNLFV